MFGAFKKRPRELGAFTLRVYQPQGREVSVSYRGEPVSKAHGLWLRGLFASKWLYTVSDVDTTAHVMSAIAQGCLKLDEEQDHHVGRSAGFELLPEGRALTTRHKTFNILVLDAPKLGKPIIDTNLPSDTTLGDVVATVAAFNESWFRQYKVTGDDLGAKSYLNFFGGFLEYYHSDPLAFRDPQSIFQAAMKADIYAMSDVIGLMGLAEE